MTEERLPSKFTFILHADIAGSTALVQQDEDVAHKRIQDTFRRFSDTITKYHGHVRELRGDALLAEFERASDAATAALAFQADQSGFLAQLDDPILPKVRVGIAMGEVIVADNTVTGEGVVLAQRIEQLAEPGGVCITGAIQEALPPRLPFDQGDLGEQQVKGFDKPVRVYTVGLKEGADLPEPTVVPESRKSKVAQFALVAAVVVLICGGGLLAWLQPWKPDFEPASVEKMALPLPNKPSIAVLPFDNLSDDEKLDIFVSGLTENVTSALAKISGIFVVAGNSVATYAGKSANVKQVAEDFGVQYVLKGAVQKSGEKLRITAQLVDAIKGHHLWAHRFDRDVEEVFAVQDEITKQVFTELQVELTEGEHARIAAGGTDSLEAWLLRIEAYNEVIKYTRESQVRALELYRAAHEADPNWAWPVAGFTWVHHYEARRGWSESREESIRLGIEAAERAIALQPGEWVGYAALANMMFMIGETEKGIELGRKSVELAPGSFAVTANFAFRLAEAGRGKEAVELFERAARLSPKHPWWIDLGHGFALHLVGRTEDAITVYQKAIDAGAISAPLRVRLAAVYADLGRMDEAKAAIEDALRFDPNFTVEKYFAGYPVGDREAWYRNLLFRAGLPENPPLELPDKPSIAVLPFNNLSGDPEKEYMADGMTEHIISSLARIPEMFVVARNSTFVYKDKPVEVRKVAQDLGVQYVLEGSLQTADNRIRVTAQLIDALSGLHVWSEQYDREMTDFFALQDDITRQIAVSMLAELAWGESAYIQASSATDLKAWLFLQQAYADFRRYTPDGNRKARDLIGKALERDPDYAQALTFMGWTHIIDARLGYSKSRSESLKLASEFSEKVASVDPEHVELYYSHALIHMVEGELDKAVENGEKLLEAVPGSAEFTAGFSMILYFAGEFDRSIELMNKAVRMSPYNPAWYDLYLGRAYAMKGDYDSAEEVFGRLTNDRTPVVLAAGGHVGKAFVYVETGRGDQAHDEIKKALAKVKWLTVSFYKGLTHFKNPTDWQRVETALRTAGLPD